MDNTGRSQMEVIKRDGRKQKVSFDKITTRIESLCWDVDLDWVDPIDIAKDTIKGIYNGITTEEIDTLSSDICAGKISTHPDFNKLAARICVSNLQKKTHKDYPLVIDTLYNNKDIHGRHCPLVSKEVFDIVMKNKDKIQERLVYKRDYNFSFFGIKTLERAYLLRKKTLSTVPKGHEKEKYMQQKYGTIIERPQHMWMRVALGIHKEDLEAAFETYDMLSNMYFTHATPTLYNSGTPRPQFSSCFLLTMKDSIDGIYKTIGDAAKISKHSGGIGIDITPVRSSGSLIRGTNGSSDGIIPMTKVFEATANYVNQGGKRKGSIACYLEVFHPDIFEFCMLRKKTGEEKLRARDLFLALWVCDLFMKRVKENGKWSLMCPDECPGLHETYGEEFEKLYLKYEKEGRYKKQVEAIELWYHILESQLETGMPYMTYKDHINKKSNQKNIGIIKSSNLCAEIVEYTDENEIAVCNLVSLCLPRFIKKNNEKLTYDFQGLINAAKIVTRNLNKIIDSNFYPTPETKTSNFKHRPIGVGIQGLADVYNIMHYPFGSGEAAHLNKQIFEAIYYGCIFASNELAKKDGPYESFEGSPMSKGKFQFNLWGLEDKDLNLGLDWESLRKDVVKHGMRNSLLTALMPTASTSQIMNNNECMEPFTTNLYNRTTIAGAYTVINEHLIRDLLKLKIWSDEMRKEILFNNGSVQNIKEIPEDIRKVYLTAFETSQKSIIKQAVERGPFIDQSQSLNLFIAKPNTDILTSCHMYGWKNGIKTGMYYLRSRPAVDPIKFGLDIDDINKFRAKYKMAKVAKNHVELVEETEEREDKEDPRRINEIEKNLQVEDNREDNYNDCELCGS